MGNLSGEILKTDEKTLFESTSIEDIYYSSIHNGYACVVYKLPNEESRNLIIDTSGGTTIDHLRLDELGSGLIFHPFSSDNHPIKFINKDIHIKEKIESKKIDLIYSKASQDELKELLKKSHSESTRHAKNQTHLNVDLRQDQKSDFMSLINRTIQEINCSTFQKAVMARSKEIELPDQFNAYKFFEKLNESYENAFVYLAFVPKSGSWMGATPETLISISEDRQFHTVALAATQAFEPTQDLEETTWSQKDIEEQAMVSRYIINCFKKIRLREFEEIGPRTHLSGNLVHLKTDFLVDMDQVAFPELGSVMLELLHSTSAVCGMPKETSKAFIEQHEGFDREYFSGFLGPVNIDDATNIYVNLRCMKLMHQRAKLYSGAGIISNSNPEKEWNETEIKMDTLLDVLKELYE